MSTLNGKSVASTYDQVVKRQDSYSATGNQIEIMDDSGVIKTTPLYLDSVNSRVGIGTASPGAKLEVGDSGTANDAGTTKIKLVNGASSVGAWNNLVSGNVDANDPYFAVETRKNSGTVSEDLRIKEGNVGIGTDSPLTKMTIAQTSGNTALTFQQTDNATTNFLIGCQYNVGNAFEITPSTAAGGSTFNSPALVVDSAGDVTVSTGNLVIGTSGKGIDFSATSDATGMTNELLDDYEEGTWTPVPQRSTTTTTSTDSSAWGKYTKIGNVVYIVGEIVVGTSISQASGDTYVAGAPYGASVSASDTRYYGMSITQWSALTDDPNAAGAGLAMDWAYDKLDLSAGNDWKQGALRFSGFYFIT